MTRPKTHSRGVFVLFQVIIWGVAIAFSIYLHLDAASIPAELVGPERVRDAWIAIGFVLLVMLGCSIVWYFAWHAWVSNFNEFNRHTPPTSVDSPSELPPLFALPLTLENGSILINRGFTIQAVSFEKIVWIHSFRIHGRYGWAPWLYFYMDDHSCVKLMLQRENEAEMFLFIETLKSRRPNLFVSKATKFGHVPFRPVQSEDFKRFKARWDNDFAEMVAASKQG